MHLHNLPVHSTTESELGSAKTRATPEKENLKVRYPFLSSKTPIPQEDKDAVVRKNPASAQQGEDASMFSLPFEQEKQGTSPRPKPG